MLVTIILTLRLMMVVVNMQWKIMTVTETVQLVKIVLVNVVVQPWKMNVVNVMVMVLKCVGTAVMSVMLQIAQISQVHQLKLCMTVTLLLVDFNLVYLVFQLILLVVVLQKRLDLCFPIVKQRF